MNTRLLLSASALAIVASLQAAPVVYFSTDTDVFSISSSSFSTLSNGGAVAVSGVSFFGGTGQNVFVKMAPASIDNNFIGMNGGAAIDFLATANSSSPLLRISFASASVDPLLNTLFASNTLPFGFTDSVTYSGSLVGAGDPADASNSLSITYSQITPGSYKGTLTGTGAVQAVPEPASMAALGLGALALIRKRRNRA